MITPLGKAGLYGRVFFDLVVVTLMISGAILTGTRHITRAFMIGFVVVNAALLVAGRIHPTPLLHQVGSLISTATLLLYVRIVLLLMFRQGPITWSRIQGGICAYLLIGMAWASAYSLAQDVNPGSFQFVSPPLNIDQLTAKLDLLQFFHAYDGRRRGDPGDCSHALAFNCRSRHRPALSGRARWALW